MRMRSFFSIASFMVVLLFAMTVSADTKAEKYYQQAQKAYDQGEFEQAAKLLKKAYQEEANLVYIYNRIRALEGAEKYQQALKLLKKYEEPMLQSSEFNDIQKLKREYQHELKQKQKTKTQTDNSEFGARKKVAFGLVGSSGVMYGLAAVFGSYLPYKKKTRKKFGTDRGFTQEEVKAIKTNRALTIIFLGVGTAALTTGGILLFDDKPTTSPKVSMYGDLGELGLQLKF